MIPEQGKDILNCTRNMFEPRRIGFAPLSSLRLVCLVLFVCGLGGWGWGSISLDSEFPDLNFPRKVAGGQTERLPRLKHIVKKFSRFVYKFYFKYASVSNLTRQKLPTTLKITAKSIISTAKPIIIRKFLPRGNSMRLFAGKIDQMTSF